ncbi:MAG: hypothetical protein JO110_14690 [Acetobacteraceae bacterium]|nr:hypothetical protein [Acetobacteraceae bacterium]
MRNAALRLVFRVRVLMENAIRQSIAAGVAEGAGDFRTLLSQGSFFGSSKKQGTSLRMPLSSCVPTRLCGAGCYAHDGRDAVAASVVRGVVNGFVAESFESGSGPLRHHILQLLEPHTRCAIDRARAELARLPPGYARRAHVRFSHVGEIVAFPEFANTLAAQVTALSNGEVDCVVYTRHPGAKRLDTGRMVVNFTLDQSSQARREWAPPGARIVSSAFDGQLDPNAEVNFLEHHANRHLHPIGIGKVCPATAPETRVRTCDAMRCALCFKPPRADSDQVGSPQVIPSRESALKTTPRAVLREWKTL